MNKTARIVVITSIVLTPVIVLVAFISTGFGHGSYVGARIILPFACLAISLNSFSSGLAVIAIVVSAVFELPLYGYIIIRGMRREQTGKHVGGILLAHCVAVIGTFTVFSGPFH